MAAPEMDAPFAIGEQAIQWIIGLARRVDARRILEFGSGRSTSRLALDLAAAEITSIEHEPRYVSEAEAMLTELGVRERVTLIRSPLGWWRHGSRVYYTYLAEIQPAPYDLVLIDGPPGYLHTGRQGALHKVFGLLPIGAHVVLDDFNEAREQRALARWLRDYPDCFAWEKIDVGHTLLLLRKTRSAAIAPATALIRANNLLDNGRGVLRRGAHWAAQRARSVSASLSPAPDR